MGIVRAPNEEQLHDVLAEDRDPLARARADWRDQEFFHARRARPFPAPHAKRIANGCRRSISPPPAARSRKRSRAKVSAAKRFASGFKLLDQLEAVARGTMAIPDWRKALPPSSSWWFLVDRYFAADPLLTVGFVTTNKPVETHDQKEMLKRELPVAGRADDAFRLELHPDRSDSLVASPIDSDQRPDGVLRRLPSRRALSRLAALVDPDRHSRPRHRRP